MKFCLERQKSEKFDSSRHWECCDNSDKVMTSRPGHWGSLCRGTTWSKSDTFCSVIQSQQSFVFKTVPTKTNLQSIMKLSPQLQFRSKQSSENFELSFQPKFKTFLINIQLWFERGISNIAILQIHFPRWDVSKI